MTVQPISGTPYLLIAERLPAFYGLENCQLDFLQHSDTITYKVTHRASGRVFLLRLHVPVTAAMGSHGDDITALRSELAWLEALNQDTNLVLQHPVRSTNGELAVSVLDEVTLKPVNATLLTWLDGESYRREFENEDMAWQMGVILAKLHGHASLWQPPSWFTRPTRDAVYFDTMLEGLRPAVQTGRIRQTDFLELERSVRRLQATMCTLGNNPKRCGIMHADPHKGNLLFQGREVRLIDFSFCAVGDYLFDLSVALADLRPELHRSFWSGYKSLRLPPEGYQTLVEAFFIGMMVGTFNYLAAKPETQAILNRKVPQIAQEYAVKFNRGESFWF